MSIFKFAMLSSINLSMTNGWSENCTCIWPYTFSLDISLKRSNLYVEYW